MRKLWKLLIALALSAPALTGTLTAQQAPGGWVLRFEVTRDAFTGASRDTTAVPGVNIDIGPAPRAAFDVGLSRELGAWEIGLAAGYASGGLRATTDATIIDDRTGNVARFRAALVVGRRVARLGSAALYITAGPSVDHWRSDGIGNRTTIGGRGGLTVRFPLGPLSLENSVRFGLSGSPFKAAHLPPEAEVRALHTWSVGVGLVIPVGR